MQLLLTPTQQLFHRPHTCYPSSVHTHPPAPSPFFSPPHPNLPLTADRGRLGGVIPGPQCLQTISGTKWLRVTSEGVTDSMPNVWLLRIQDVYIAHLCQGHSTFVCSVILQPVYGQCKSIRLQIMIVNVSVLHVIQYMRYFLYVLYPTQDGEM